MFIVWQGLQGWGQHESLSQITNSFHYLKIKHELTDNVINRFLAYRFSVFTHHTKIFSLIFSKHFLLSVENKKFGDNRQSGKIKLEL